MKRPRFLLIGLGSLAYAVFATAAPPTPTKPDPAAAAKGQVTYARYCASCHGPVARGDGPMAPELRVSPPDLTAISARNGGSFPFDAIAQAIDGRKTTRGHGLPDMPVWGEVFRRTKGTDAPSPAAAVSHITHYLWTLQRVGT